MLTFLLCFILFEKCVSQHALQRDEPEQQQVLPLAPMVGHVVNHGPPLMNGIIFVGNDDPILPNANGPPAVGQLEAPGPQDPSHTVASGSSPGNSAPGGDTGAVGPNATIRPRRTRRPTASTLAAVDQQVPSTEASPSVNSTFVADVSSAATQQNFTASAPEESAMTTLETISELPYYVVSSCKIVQCNPTSVCKVIDNEAKCIPTVGDKKGQCPVKGEAAKPQDDSACAKVCADDQSCDDDLKCCAIDCGKSCHKPRPNNPCDAKPCPSGNRCKPEIKSCLEGPCPQYRCDPISRPTV